MKIIQQGNKDLALKMRRFECNKCKCIFEADKSEYESGSQYNDIYYYAKCPCCKNTVYAE